MAQQTTVALLDDLDGSKAGETVAFGIDGITYEIDLNVKNAKALRTAFAEFAEAARPIRPSKPAPLIRRRSTASRARADNTAIREWALAQGIEISGRGRISADVLEQYAARRS